MRSLLANFPTENATIVKQDKSIIDNIPALFDNNKIFIDDSSIIIEEGDIIERILPNGAKEQYIVIDRGFMKGIHGIPDHYQIKCKKISNYSNLSKNSIINNYNIKDANKININSNDNSIEITYNENNIELFNKLKSLCNEINLDNKEEVINSINEMEKNIGKKSFTDKYNSFIQSIANHITIFAPFIPILSEYLNH